LQEVLRHSQAELLQEAAITESENVRSLEQMQKMEDDKRKEMAPKAAWQGALVRRHSKKGAFDTITFTGVDDFPAAINAGAPACE
jgi:hypothetical protein